MQDTNAVTMAVQRQKLKTSALHNLSKPFLFRLKWLIRAKIQTATYLRHELVFASAVIRLLCTDENLYCQLDPLYLKRIMTTKADKTIDCLGLFCPEPVFKTRMQLDEMVIGETLEITADDPAAKSDIENLAKNLGQEVLESVQEGNVTRIILKKVK